MHRYRIVVDGKPFTLDVRELAADAFRVQVEGKDLDVRLSEDEELAEGAISPAIVGWGTGGAVAPAAPPQAQRHERLSSTALTAPMPGLIVSVDVKPGMSVKRGDSLLTLEAMKMRNSIRAPRGGIVAEVVVEEGQSVGFGELLLRFGDTP